MGKSDSRKSHLSRALFIRGSYRSLGGYRIIFFGGGGEGTFFVHFHFYIIITLVCCLQNVLDTSLDI